jgi:hypothetical protein
MAQQILMGQGLLVLEVSLSKSDTPHSVGLLWLSDQPNAEIFTWQHTTLKETNIHVNGGIWTRNPSKREVAEPRPKPRGHRHRSAITRE